MKFKNPPIKEENPSEDENIQEFLNEKLFGKNKIKKEIKKEIKKIDVDLEDKIISFANTLNEIKLDITNIKARLDKLETP